MDGGGEGPPIPRGLGGKPFAGPGPFEPPELGGEMSWPRLIGNGPPSPYLDMLDNQSFPPYRSWRYKCISITGTERERRKAISGHGTESCWRAATFWMASELASRWGAGRGSNVGSFQ